MSQRKSNFLIAVVMCSLPVATYAVSFFTPTFEIVVEGKPDVSYGYDAFVIGFFSPYSPFFGGLRVFIPWLANPLFWFGVVGFVTHRYRRACVAGVIATAISTTLWLFNDPESRNLLLIGYNLWVLSMFQLTVAITIRWMWITEEPSEPSTGPGARI